MGKRRKREFVQVLRLLESFQPNDVLAGVRAKLRPTNPPKRLNGKIKRRSDVVGIFPNEAAVIRLIGALLLEQNNDEWAVQRARCMSWKPSHP
jgi:transposase-like protein